MQLKFNFLAASLAGILPLSAVATTYPVTFTDTDGQKITLQHEPKRVVLQDGRDIMSLALLDRDNPFTRVVAWNNNLKKSDPQTVSLLADKWPTDIKRIPDMGFNDKGEINTEQVIAQQPDVLIAQLRAKPALIETGVVSKLQDAGIPIVYVDTFIDPIKNTKESINLLGLMLNKEKEAGEYTAFYQSRLDDIRTKTAAVGHKPLVFIEAKAGANGSGCCFTHNTAGWGGMVKAAGGDNLGSHFLPGATGDIALEQVISSEPEVYIVTGSRWTGKSSIAAPFGYGVSQQQAKQGLDNLKQRVGLSNIKAVANNRYYGVYHNFYNHPYNIVGLEFLAKFIYPETFKGLNPNDTYDQIIKNYTTLPVAQGLWGTQDQ